MKMIILHNIFLCLKTISILTEINFDFNHNQNGYPIHKNYLVMTAMVPASK